MPEPSENQPGEPTAVTEKSSPPQPIDVETLTSPGLPTESLAGLPATGTLGDYRLVRVIGSGGMGVVFEARDTRLDRDVALKVMKLRMAAAPEARERFLREARAAAAVDHEHVVTIYQAGEDRGTLYLAMPLLRGETLADRLTRDRLLPIGEAARMGREVALGLIAAHDHGLIHRDVKPSNVWLEAGTNRVKLLDFGLARQVATDGRLTSEGALLGTPYYMAPEQAAGRTLTPACDGYSLGCVLYQMVTGELPFQGDSVVDILAAVTRDTPEPPRAVNPAVPAKLSELIMALLGKDPAKRPPLSRVAAELQREADRDATRTFVLDRPLVSDQPEVMPRWKRVALVAAVLAAGAGVWYGLRPVSAPPVPVADPPRPVAVAPEPRPVPTEPAVVVDQGGTGRYRSISDAIAFSPDGSLIVVKPGVYRESLAVNKPLRITGEGAVAVESDDRAPLLVTADNVRIKGLAFRVLMSDEPKPKFRNAVEVRGAKGVVFESCEATSVRGNGLVVTGPGTEAALLNCHIHDNSDNGFCVHDGAKATATNLTANRNRRDGVRGFNGTLDLVKCKLEQNGVGLSAQVNSRVTATDCKIDNNTGTGVVICNTAYGLLTRCSMRSNASNGAHMWNKVDVTFADCVVSDNPGDGIAGYDTTVTVRGTRVQKHGGTGIVAAQNSAFTLEDVDCTENRIAVRVEDTSTATRTNVKE